MDDSRIAPDKKAGSVRSGSDKQTARSDAQKQSVFTGYQKLALLLCLIAGVVIFRAFVIDRVIVSGDSMNDAFQDGDVLWARKFCIDGAERFDVVVVKYGGRTLIKRIIGLPNETVSMRSGSVFINDHALLDDCGEFITFYGTAAGEGISLSDNEYFLLGDNRNNSLDSREFGAVAASDIKGVIIFQVYPFHEMGVLKRKAP